VTLNLPGEALVSHLGFDPQGGICRRGETPAGRLLLELIRNTAGGDGSAFSQADSYMQLAVYDLVGALFAPSDLWPVSWHAEKFFTRIRALIKDRLVDPDFGPADVAAEAGISLRASRSSLRSAALAAVNSSIPFGWSTPRAFCSAGRCWVQTSPSARLSPPAAFTTIRISHAAFAIGSVTRQAPTRREIVTAATEQCAPVLAEVRQGLSTPTLGDLNSSQHRSRTCGSVAAWAVLWVSVR
jgi:hypothetical protein